MKINIITDNTCSLDLDYIKQEELVILPICCTLNDKTYNITDPAEYNEFYELVDRSEEFPKTSQPALGEMVDAFNKALADDPDYVLVLTISKGLSGTYESLINAKNYLGDDRLIIVDTKTTTVNLKRMVEYACELRKTNLDIDEIVNRLNKMRETQSVFFIPENLEYLFRGGRLSRASSAVGDFLKIFPIITLRDDGKLVMHKKIRGEKKAFRELESYITDDIKYISVVYVLRPERAVEFKEKVEEKLPNARIIFEPVAPNIGCHTGPGTVGILFGTYYDLEERNETIN